MEQSVSCENNFLITILHEPADTVLGMARSVVSLDTNVLSDLEAASVWSRFTYCFAVFAANDLLAREFLVLELPTVRTP